MNLKNHTYYFGRIPADRNYAEESLLGWEPGFYFRFTIPRLGDDQINFEDTCDRMVPFNFENLCEMRDTLNKIINDIAVASVGADYNAMPKM